MTTATMEKSATKVVTPAEWLAARKQFLAKEKEFTRMRDELSRLRRELPWEKVEKNYVFEGANGKETLADLFGPQRTARRLSLHVWSRMERRMPELLVPCGLVRRGEGASGAAGYSIRGCIASDLSRDRSV